MFWNEGLNATDAKPTPSAPATTKPMYFQSGSPTDSKKATIVKAEFLNTISAELLNLVYEAELTPDKYDDTQLVQAIRKICNRQIANGGSDEGTGGISGGGFRMFSSRTSGKWTVPTNVSNALAILTGAGASGAVGGDLREASGGSAGGTCIKSVSLTPGTTVSFTIGAGGGGVSSRLSNGIDGGASTCTTFGMIANGGKAGTLGNVAGAAGAPGGKSEGGDINLRGGPGGVGLDCLIQTATLNTGGVGGASYWGIGGMGSLCGSALTNVPTLSAADLNGTNPGSGGGGMGQPDVGYSNYQPLASAPSGSGADGIIMILY